MYVADRVSRDSAQDIGAAAVHDHVEASPEIADPLMGKTLGGRWVIDAVLGEGAMGRVYRGHHLVLQKPVAVKVLRSELCRHEAIAARFLREARAASTIVSPHVVEVLDFGRVGENHYLVMEYLAGGSLETVLEQGAVPLPMVYDLAIALAQGLGAAHQAGVVHRDVKPDNVVMIPHGDGTFACKIVDFGIAKVREDVCSARLTTPGSMIGTPYYMSPELCLGRSADHRTDIYSLGAMLYELIAGRPPFDSDTLAGLLGGHISREPTPLRQLVPECPQSLADVVQRCMRKQPEDRYASMEDVCAELEIARKQALGGQAAQSSSIRPVAPFVPKPRRRMRAVVAASVVALSAAASLMFAYASPDQAAAQRVLSDANHAVVTSSAAANLVTATVPIEAPVEASEKRRSRVASAPPAEAEAPKASPPPAEVAAAEEVVASKRPRVAVAKKRATSDVVDPWK